MSGNHSEPCEPSMSISSCLKFSSSVARFHFAKGELQLFFLKATERNGIL